MPPPITSMSTFFTRFMSRSILVETLAPPTIATTGRAGLPSPFSSASSSACMVLPAKAGRMPGQPFGRGVRAMRGRKGVVDEDVAVFGRAVRRRPDRSSPRPCGNGCFRAAGCRRRRAWPPPPRRRGRCSRRRRPTGLPMISATASAIGASENSGSGPPFGRPKCASRMTLAPLSESSRMVGATRSIRVASVTLPSATGTLRSTRTSTRLPLTSPIRSSVLNAAIGISSTETII